MYKGPQIEVLDHASDQFVIQVDHSDDINSIPYPHVDSTDLPAKVPYQPQDHSESLGPDKKFLDAAFSFLREPAPNNDMVKTFQKIMDDKPPAIGESNEVMQQDPSNDQESQIGGSEEEKDLISEKPLGLFRKSLFALVSGYIILTNLLEHDHLLPTSLWYIRIDDYH
jgi:hypothetical protein